jgi:hypothetical protein
MVDKPHSKYEHIFVVLRSLDKKIEHPEYLVSLTKAYATQADAEREAARMNELNGPEGSRYFVQIARFVPAEPSESDT